MTRTAVYSTDSETEVHLRFLLDGQVQSLFYGRMAYFKRQALHGPDLYPNPTKPL